MKCEKCGGTLLLKRDVINNIEYLSCFNCGKTYNNRTETLRFHIKDKTIIRRNDDMKVLVKIPSRERPNKIFKVLDLYIGMSRNENTVFLLTLDKNDPTMNSNFVISMLDRYVDIMKGRLSYTFGESKGKIFAVNRDVETEYDWDILILASDDMIPQMVGYDNIVINTMKKYYPDTDGILWFNDGYVGIRLNTLPILGRKYYNRFGYVYYPEYITWWADNEFTEVGNMLGKQVYIQDCIIKHEHPANNSNVIYDELYNKNDAPSNTSFDLELFNKRKEMNFYLNMEDICI